ncbi:MAG: hypothetical protein ACYTBV_10495 [Planctomycetota bacterium]|jgi:hypothetical protein
MLLKNFANKEAKNMRISNAAFSILAMAVIFVFTAQPVVQAGQGLDTWPLEPGERGDSSVGCLTIYYSVVGWDDDQSEEEVLMFFFLRLYEKKTKKWLFISDVAKATTLLTFGVLIDKSQQAALIDFLNGPVKDKLWGSYNSVHLTKVENDIHNFGYNKPPYAVSADITLVAK